MKIFNLIVVFSILSVAVTNTLAQNTYVPDDNFELALIDLGYDSGVPDDYVPTANISSVTILNVSGKSISNLTGIEAFAALTDLNCANNNLSSLDLSGNPALQELSCFNNQLTGIDVSSNSNLAELVCYNNQLISLDVSENQVLLKLNCSNNQLTALDLSLNTSLTYVNCSNNELTSLNLKNGNNTNMTGGNYYDTGIDSRNNPDLFCIQVDNVENAISYYTWYEDFWSEYNLDCSGFTIEKAYVPDDNFEQALISLGYDYGTPDDYTPTTSLKKVTSLNVNNRNISNLTGIESFNALKTLYCSSNQLTECDFSANTNLNYLDCSSNQITQLNISGNSQLQTLYCQYNALVDIDINSNTNLTRLYCNNNKLTGLDLRNANSSLRINATNNPNLFCIQVDDEEAASNNYNWDKSTYTAYSEDCSSYVPEMTYVPDDNFEQALINAGCDAGDLNDSVATIAIKSRTYLSIGYNNIEDLTGIEDFAALEQLDCYNNQIITLDLSSNVNLKVLRCYSNKITSLNLTSNPLLTELNCNNNSLSELDISSNPLITKLDARNNQLSGVNLRNGNNSNMSCDLRYNPDLLCIEVDDPETSYSKSNWYKTAYAGYSENCSVYVPEMTYVPDDNFEQALIDAGYDYGELNDSVPTNAIKYIKTFSISYKNIKDLTGIEDFTSLTDFYCSGNMISEINLSNNILLKNLYIDNNNLEALDLKSNTALTYLNCSNNHLSSLDLRNGNNTNMTVNTQNNFLTCIAVDNPEVIIQFSNWHKDAWTEYSSDCSGYISEMVYVPDDNFEQALINLGYDFGELNDSVSQAIIRNVTSLYIVGKGINDLTGIEHFNNLKRLECGQNALASLDLSANKKLETLICENNELNALSIQSNNSLTTVYCYLNNLTELILPESDSLVYVSCGNNPFETLNTYSLSNLETLDCSNGSLKKLDISKNTKLKYISVQNNQLVDLNLQNGNNANMRATVNNNPYLFCIQVDNPALSATYTKWYKDSWASYSEECISYSAKTYIPDDNFEQALIDLGYDSGALDDSVLTISIKDITSLNIGNKNISDLTGIEDFESLTSLICSLNQLTELNLNNNKNLNYLECGSNKLDSLNLNSLNLSHISCSYNNLSFLKFDNSTNLNYLNCSVNSIGNINLINCPFLEELHCSNNKLTSIDLSNNSGLTKAFLFENELRMLNLQNGNNYNISNIDVSNNTNLSCIQVDNVPEANSFVGWTKDNWANYSEDCSNFDNRRTYIPDDNFEQALIDLGYDSGELDDSVYTANIEDLTVLNISNKSISDLTGIEDFKSLEYLYCHNNLLSTLNLSSNQKISCLSCDNNNLTELILGANKNIRRLECSHNQLTSVKLNGLSKLRELHLDFNNLVNIELNNTDSLTVFSANNNELTTLNLSGKDSLISLMLISNQLSTLDLSDNALLYYLSVQFNQLNDLDLNTLTQLTNLICSDNQLISLDLSHNINLYEADLRNNNLTELNVQNGNNNILTINMQNNPNLLCIQVDNPEACNSNPKWNKNPYAQYSVDCSNYNFDMEMVYVPDDNFEQYFIDHNHDFGPLNDSVPRIGLDTVLSLYLPYSNIYDLTGIENCENLEYLECSNNHLTSLDLSSNTKLISLLCLNNNLTELNLKNGNNPNMTGFGNMRATNNPNLTCIQVDDAVAAANYSDWFKDYWARYAEDCSIMPDMAYVPDDNFEQRLIDFHFNQGPLNDSVVVAALEKVQMLWLDNANIKDLTGIEKCKNLFFLTCSNNQLTKIDLSKNRELTDLYCYQNQIANLNLSSNTKLKRVVCSNNLLTSLNLNKNVNLVSLECQYNSIEYIDLSNNPRLDTMFCNNNHLTSVNIKNSNNSSLHFALFNDNPNLTCIQVDNVGNAQNNTAWVKDSWAEYSLNCGAAGPGVPLSEYNALVDFYNNLDGDNWSRNDNWRDTTNVSVADWYGITVTDNHVTKIEFGPYEYYNLNGSLPNSIGDLTKLETLSIITDNLHGEIPLRLFELTNLKTLTISECKLSGSLPKEIGNLTNLEVLGLEANNLEGSIPAEIGNLKNLRFLSLSENNFSGELPSSIGNLTNLWYLGLADNDLSGAVPSSFGNLTKLLFLLLHNNKFVGPLPEELANLIDIKKISLKNNLIGNIDLNKSAQLDDNRQIPDELAGLLQMDTLYLGGNKLQFNDIEAIFSWENYNSFHEFVYAPQDSIGKNQTLIAQAGNAITLSISNYYPGPSDQYQWYKNNAAIENATAATLELSELNLNDAGKYYCKIINLVATNLTLNSRLISLNVVEDAKGAGVPQKEFTALVELYDNFYGDEWLNHQNWLDTIAHSVSDWHGITVENGNITALDLSGLNLEGDISSYFADFDSLKWLNLAEQSFQWKLVCIIWKRRFAKITNI